MTDKLIYYKNVELHRKEQTVLEQVDLTVDPGEFVYLIGKIGSGKSTLLKSMYGEVPVSSGQAVVLGYDLLDLKRRDIPGLRRKLGIVFQDFRLLTDRSIGANLEFVLRATGWTNREQINRRIGEVLKLVGMQTKTYKQPHELSGGEQQRVVIARALLNRPALILADEPTGNLDPETGDRTVARLRAIADSGTAVIMATHNLSFVDRYPGRIVTCDKRRIIH